MRKDLQNFEKIINIAREKTEDEIIPNSFEKGYSLEEIGNMFEKSLKRLERKSKGQYYTPKEVVDYIVSYLKINENTTIIDPTSGCGSFLLAIVDKLKSKSSNPNYQNIFGVDLNETAVRITRLSLVTRSGSTRKLVDLFEKNIRVGNSLVLNKKLTTLAFQWKQEFKEVFSSGGFDIVIGNPPYVTLKKYKDFDPKESLYPCITNGPVNAATLMIGKGLEVLKSGGILAFVLPKTILHVESYSKLREYILKRAKIIHVFDLGLKFKNVRGEQIILIVKKEKPSNRHVIEIKILKDKEKSLKKQQEYKIKQSLFIKSNKILMFDNKEYYKLLEKLTNKGVCLSEFVGGFIFRGFTINSNSLYVTKNKKGNTKKLIRGKFISKFRIKDFMYIDKKLVNKLSKWKSTLLGQNKIVLQNIFSSESGVIAAYDSKGVLSLDTVTNIIIGDEVYAKYVLGLLNSKVINFYLIYGLYNRSRLTMHTDKAYIGELPVVLRPKKGILKKVVSYVENAVCEDTEERVKEITKEIDELICEIYELNQKETKLINSGLYQMLSKKSRW